MIEADVDRVLMRGLFLQRYVTSLFNDVRKGNEKSDRTLIAALGEFVADADESTLAALSNQRTSNPQARRILGEIKQVVRDQRSAANDRVNEEVLRLARLETAFMSSVMGIDPPSDRGVATEPVSGTKIPELILAAYTAYSTRLISEITQAAATGAEGITRIVRGRRSEKFRDGLFWWRDNRLLQPNIDRIVNGVAANAARHVYTAADVELVDHLATLDYRTCPRCVAAEANGPYRLGSEPRIPIHINCRCRSIVHVDGLTNERPFVRDDRSVKNIPKSERDNKIGQTRRPIESFFDRMSKADRIAYMGPTRALLWEQGKINDIKQLVDQRTLRPLRLDELPEP